MFFKDGDSRLDYRWDWSEWLTGFDDIETAEVLTRQLGGTGGSLAVDAVSSTDSDVVVWLSGGAHNEKYAVTCRISTAEGRIADDTVTVDVLQR